MEEKNLLSIEIKDKEKRGNRFLIHISLILYLTKKRQRKEPFLWKGGLSFIFRDKKSQHTSYATLTIPA